MEQKHDVKTFFRYVIPSVLSFALAGVYAIVDGFFVGNSLGDIGLSAVNIAYPERIRQLNDSMALFVELFSKAGGKNGTEA